MRDLAYYKSKRIECLISAERYRCFGDKEKAVLWLRMADFARKRIEQIERRVLCRS